MKKILIFSITFIFIITLGLIIYPKIEIMKKGKLIKFAYNEDLSLFAGDSCYDESYYYNEKRDISIYNFHTQKFLFFYKITYEYKDGNICETEYLLEEEYITNFINNAIIEYNEHNIDLASLIDGKKAIVGNKKYLGNDYEKSIGYILDGEHDVLYIFYVDDMLIIQVGLSDEGPKFIAYK